MLVAAASWLVVGSALASQSFSTNNCASSTLAACVGKSFFYKIIKLKN
jgi:hypothetical protein